MVFIQPSELWLRTQIPRPPISLAQNIRLYNVSLAQVEILGRIRAVLNRGHRFLHFLYKTPNAALP